MILHEIERRSNLSMEEFREEYLKPRKPVVFTDLMKDWPALTKWSASFFKENYGHLMVPVYSSNYSKPGKGYMTHDTQMDFKSFLETTEKGNTDLRLFLYDIFGPAPELRQDIRYNGPLNDTFKRFPFCFFGGAGAEVTLHYDIDCANVFLSQFVGHKRVILFAPEESKKIYHHPFTVKSLIDPVHPDYEKFPALKYVEGYETILQHGETIFMPSRYWHHMEYLDFSFGMALRSQNGLHTHIRGVFNLAAHFLLDKGFNFAIGNKWHEWKEKKAFENAKPFEQ